MRAWLRTDRSRGGAAAPIPAGSPPDRAIRLRRSAHPTARVRSSDEQIPEMLSGGACRTLGCRNAWRCPHRAARGVLNAVDVSAAQARLYRPQPVPFRSQLYEYSPWNVTIPGTLSRDSVRDEQELRRAATLSTAGGVTAVISLSDTTVRSVTGASSSRSRRRRRGRRSQTRSRRLSPSYLRPSVPNRRHRRDRRSIDVLVSSGRR